MNPTTHHPMQSRPGFTLIEVLIAILILALGLLGLGAVFPVVISQQREATAVVDGESVASMAENIVRSSTEIIDFSPWFDPTSNFGEDNAGNPRYEWVVRQPAGDTTYSNWPNQPGHLNADYTTGIWVFDQDNPPNITLPAEMNQLLTVSDRLYPQPYSGADPKYVWDIVARRQPGTNRPQLGLFIRSVDPRIRVPNNFTLSDVLITGTPGFDPLLPVAIDGGTGRPAVDNGDPQFVYAAIQTLQVQVRQEQLDWLIFENADNSQLDTSIAFAAQPGQKLLDNSGTVRTILGPPPSDPNNAILSDTSARVVRVNPPFQFHQAVNSTGSLNQSANTPNTDSERASWIHQVVFTPRTPLAIRVITIEESAP